jgi:hypothetical protein
MRVAIFFGYLCFLLLKGYGYIYADSQYDYNRNTLAHTIATTAQQLKFTNPNQNTVSNEVEEYLVDDDIEDADGGNNFFARKYKLLTRPYVTQPHTFILTNSRFKARQPFCSHSSHKCVVQRALRI